MKDRQYNQKLSPERAAEGINAAIVNSKALLDDALLLFDNERYERAVALSILAIEEAGKPSIIRSILLEDDPKSLKKEWQNYRRHTEKNTNWIVPELVSKGARHIKELRQTVDKDSDHTQLLDNLKQLAFYSDAFSKCKWSIPKNVVDKDLAKSILEIAKIMVGKDTKGMTSEAELILWVKHLKPVWKKDMFKMKQALINCYQEAEELGLMEKGITNNMVEFLL